MSKELATPYERIHFVNHSHVDHTWWNSPEVCRKRNEEIIDTVLELCSKHPGFRFSYETTAALMDYLQSKPDRKDAIADLLKSGRVDVGGLFASVNAGACSEETVARNFYLGKRWLETVLGYSPVIAKEHDTPGHTLQMPQLVKSAGMETLVISRGPQGGFTWVGPDKSDVFVFCVPYNWSYWRKLGVSFEQTEERLPAELERAVTRYPGPALIIPDGDDMTLPNPELLEIVKQWNENYDRPELVLSTMQDCIAGVRPRRPLRRVGDMPNLWVVIHALQVQATRDMKALQNMLPSAEAIGVVLAVHKGNFKSYPTSEINSCWRRALLVADHNWGGKDKDSDGDAGDGHKAQLSKKALRDSQKVLGDVFDGLMYALKSDPNSIGMPMLVFNPTGWQSNGAVSVEISCSIAGLEGVEIVNRNDEKVPFDVEVLERHNDDSIYRLRADFLASDLPSIGYSTYYAKPILERKEIPALHSEPGERIIENEYYRVEFAEDGSCIKSLYDKELDLELAGRFNVAAGPLAFEFGMFEIFGAGLRLTVPERSFFENPENEGSGESVELTGDIWRASDYPATVRVEQRSGFAKTLIAEGDFIESRRRQKVLLYEGLKRVDIQFEIDWKGKSDATLFLQMPNALMDGETYVNVPFGVHRNGDELTEFWIDEAMPIKFKVRGIQDWLCCEKEGRGIAIATRWPIVDLTMVPGFPLLWTNDNSGFFFGERYRQAGTHSYSFSITSYEGTWQENNIHHWGKQWARPALTLLTDDAPAEKVRSYVSVDSSNIVISALKKAQDEDAIVVRLYETTGKKTAAQLNTSFPIKRAVTTNLIETSSRKLVSQNDSIKLSFRPFEIKTVKLYM